MTSAGTAISREAESSAESKVKLRALLVEDNAVDAELVLRALRGSGFEVVSDLVQSAEDFRRVVRSNCPDVVLADYNLPQWTGMEALEILRQEGLDVPLILVSGALGDVKAVECIKQGATDYVLKDSMTRLPASVRRALQEKDLRQQRKKAEGDLAQKAEELARSNHELEQFAYVASHDLQEPLRMVASYTELLAERYHGKLDDKADKYIAYAVDGAKRMQRLINDLLAYARVGSRAGALQPTDAAAVLDSVVTMMRQTIAVSQAEVVWEKLPMVRADEVQLGQVFQNLIGNALKFHGPRSPRIEIGAAPKDGMWRFSVADNGIGIAAESGGRIRSALGHDPGTAARGARGRQVRREA